MFKAPGVVPVLVPVPVPPEEDLVDTTVAVTEDIQELRPATSAEAPIILLEIARLRL